MKDKEIKELAGKIGKNFIHVQHIIEGMFVAHSMGENFLMYGPGGHGKSEIALAFLRNFYEETDIFMCQFGKGTRLEQILGHINLKAFTETGVLTFNFENGFLNKKAAIFEEMLDAPANLLEALKDVLMRGAYCVGEEVCYTSMCNMIVSCTNYDPSGWATNESEKAFIERFPYRANVKWPSYTDTDFEEMFKRRGVSNPAFARMMAYAHEQGQAISPRTAMKAVKAYKKFGLKGIEQIGDIPKSLFHHFERLDRDATSIEILTKACSDSAADYARHKTAVQKARTLEEVLKVMALVKQHIANLTKVPAPTHGDLIRKVSDQLNHWRAMEQPLVERIMQSVGAATSAPIEDDDQLSNTAWK